MIVKYVISLSIRKVCLAYSKNLGGLYKATGFLCIKLNFNQKKAFYLHSLMQHKTDIHLFSEGGDLYRNELSGFAV